MATGTTHERQCKIRFSDDQLTAIKQAAKADDRSIASFIRVTLANHLGTLEQAA